MEYIKRAWTCEIIALTFSGQKHEKALESAMYVFNEWGHVIQIDDSRCLKDLSVHFKEINQSTLQYLYKKQTTFDFNSGQTTQSQSAEGVTTSAQPIKRSKDWWHACFQLRGPLNVQCVRLRSFYWQKWNKNITLKFPFVFNHLKLSSIVFLLL